MRFVDTPPLPAGPTTGHPEWIGQRRLRPSPPLPVLGAAFAAGILLSTSPGRGVLRGLLRTALLLARPALIASGLCKLGELSAHSTARPASHSTIT
jgi:hypothetical protein